MKNWTPVVLMIVGLAIASGCQKRAEAQKQVELTTPGTGECQVDMSVEGMMCQHNCAPTVQRTLRGIEGVKEAVASFKEKKASVLATGELCEERQAESLVDALDDAGYGAEISKITNGS